METEMSQVDLRLGDCLEVMKTLPDGAVDAVITDPPYITGGASTRRGTRAQSPIGDWTNAARWYKDWLSECFRIANSNAPVWMFGNWRTLPVLEIAVQSLARRITSVLVWDKQWIGVGSMNGLRCQYELVFLMGGPDFSIQDRAIGDIWQEKWSSARPNGHTAEKPVSLVERMLSVSMSEQNILDPFMGSGTTGVACVQTGRNFIGIEIDPNYFAIAEKRIKDAQCQITMELPS
jgi:DNA modification methylase